MDTLFLFLVLMKDIPPGIYLVINYQVCTYRVALKSFFMFSIKTVKSNALQGVDSLCFFSKGSPTNFCFNIKQI